MIKQELIQENPLTTRRQISLLQKLDSQHYLNRYGCLVLWYGDEDWSDVLSLKDWTDLNSLDIRKCQIRYFNVQPLMLYNWSNLRSLLLSDNNIGGIGARILSKLNLINLNLLSLQRCHLGNEGAKQLTKIRCPNIKDFNIANNKIKFDGYSYWVNVDWIKVDRILISWPIGYGQSQYIDDLSMFSLISIRNRIGRLYTRSTKDLEILIFPNYWYH